MPKSKSEHLQAVHDAADVAQLNEAVRVASLELSARDMRDVLKLAEEKHGAMVDAFRAIQFNLEHGMGYFKKALTILHDGQRKGATFK